MFTFVFNSRFFPGKSDSKKNSKRKCCSSRAAVATGSNHGGHSRWEVGMQQTRDRLESDYSPCLEFESSSVRPLFRVLLD